MHRRDFCLAAAALCGGAGAALSARAQDADERYEGLATDRHLGPVEVVAKVTDKQAFTEGPAVAPDGTVFFTNVPAEKIYRWDPETRKLRVFRERSNKANGLLVDSQMRLWACEGGAHRVTRTDLKTGRREVLAAQYDGKPLAAPNDLALTRGGRLFFSSRPRTDASNVNAVYRWDPDGTLHQVLAEPRIQMPNGMGISPDGRSFYLIEAHPDADHHRDVRVYALDDQGSLTDERVLVNFYPGRSGDGMCVAGDGRLLVAAGLHARRGTSETLDTRPGIHVLSPQGRLLGFRQTPVDTLTNCAVDEDNGWLYATCRDQLLRMKLHAGAP